MSHDALLVEQWHAHGRMYCNTHTGSMLTNNQYTLIQADCMANLYSTASIHFHFTLNICLSKRLVITPNPFHVTSLILKSLNDSGEKKIFSSFDGYDVRDFQYLPGGWSQCCIQIEKGKFQIQRIVRQIFFILLSFLSEVCFYKSFLSKSKSVTRSRNSNKNQLGYNI